MGSEGESRLAACYARLGDMELAIEHFEKANEGFMKEWLYYYNMACSFARLGRVREALASLVQAVDAGYGRDPSNIRWMERDADLDAVRKLPAYQALLEDLRARFR
jgi:adenylate cyclase